MRSAVAAALAFTWALLMFVACSSTRPDPQGISGSDAGPVDGQVFDGRGASDAGLDANGDANDAGKTRCLGDTLETLDGGAAGADGGIDCSLSAACTPSCENILRHYRLGVAQEAVRCLRALPVCGGAIDVIPCVDKALAQACPVATSPGFCAPLVAGCVDSTGDAAGSFSQFGCETFANGLSSEGRSVFAACINTSIAGGVCESGVVTCADDIRQ